METFEFLNICQTHGMPRVMTVLTHLDLLRAGSQLKKARRTISRRLWGEGPSLVGKVFHISGLLSGEYLYRDMHNLARFISVIKFHSPTLQLSSPHLLADRLEDLTDPEKVRQNPWCDRRLCLYGYLRGAPMRPNSQVHIPGLGDLLWLLLALYLIPALHPGRQVGDGVAWARVSACCMLPLGGKVDSCMTVMLFILILVVHIPMRNLFLVLTLSLHFELVRQHLTPRLLLVI
uniref:ribosome biogenesis protein BMS1 homolog n=1 Tax=Myxine glutinosa TaxID=7769 RepID=UPI00358E9C3D